VFYTLSLHDALPISGGKVSLAYRGLGEVFVYLFFGLFSVMGSFYLFSLEANLLSFNLASIFGLLATTFICVNNLRDRHTDIEVGKRTLATRLSPAAYRLFTTLTIFVPYILLHFYKEMTLIYFVFLALLPALKLTHIIWTKEGSELN